MAAPLILEGTLSAPEGTLRVPEGMVCNCFNKYFGAL